jgi:nitric oxide reductase NorD protein
MSLDEFLFGRAAGYFKKKKIDTLHVINRTVYLDSMKDTLTIIARAVSGSPVDIYPAEREGGYKGNNFFLPQSCSLYSDAEANRTFYLFRTLYLCIQKQLALNWWLPDEPGTEMARKEAFNHRDAILNQLYLELPQTIEIHTFLVDQLSVSATKTPIDFTWLYGKWMKDKPEEEKGMGKAQDDKIKTAMGPKPLTTLKVKAVEEIISLQVDIKQQEDYVLTHNFEKVETAEEFSGVWRDFDGEDNLKEHENALDELNMKYTVRVDDPVHSVYQADFIENATVSESQDVEAEDHFIMYDEWDYSKKAYRPDFCKLFPRKELKSDSAYYHATINQYSSILNGLRKLLKNVDNKYRQQRRQTQGAEFDIDSVMDLFTDVHSGHTPSDKIYISNRKKEKDISILLLLDISLSSDGYSAGNRIIDVEKQVSILFGEILQEFNIDFSINCFYSKTRNYSTYITVKGFEDNWNSSRFNIGAVEPGGYTRIGTALRHSGELLNNRNTKNKWLILLSDGKPNDYDKYEGKYGIQDIRQALRELNQKDINSYALAIEASAKYYLPQMFGNNHYQILSSPVELLSSLVLLYEKIRHS